MSQRRINSNLAIFLLHTNPILSKAIKTSGGLCFGYMICHAVMRKLGKLNWWEAALSAIANWDGKMTSLKKEVHLPQQEGKQTLQTVFEKVLNFLVFNQCLNTFNFPLKDFDQTHILKQNGLFEAVGSDNKIKKIIDSKTVSGAISKEHLVYLLNDKILAERMCFILSHKHGISVYYEDPHWVIYNSNYDHTSPRTMRKKFKNKDEWLKQIFEILGQDLIINAASLEENESKKENPCYAFDELLVTDTMHLIERTGLQLLIDFNEPFIPTLLNIIEEFKESPDTIADAMICQNSHGQSGLQALAIYSPDNLLKFIKIALKSPKGKSNIIQALLLENNSGYSALETIMNCASKTLIEILGLALESAENSDRVIKYLTTPNKENWTLLHRLIVISPPHFSSVLDMIANCEGASEKIANTLLLENQFNNTILDNIAMHSPTSLIKTLKLIAKAKGGMDKIIEFLTTQRTDNWTGLHTIARYAPLYLLEVLEMISSHPGVPDKVANALVMQADKSGCLLDIIATYASSHALFETLKMAAQSKLGPDKISQALLQPNAYNQSALDVIKINSLTFIYDVLKYTACSKETRDKLSELHDENSYAPLSHLRSIKDRESYITYLIHYAPRALPSLFVIFKEETITCILKTIVLGNKDSIQVLQNSMQFATEFLPAILNKVALLKNGAIIMAKAFSEKSEDGYTGRQLIKKYAAKFTPYITKALAASLKRLDLDELHNLEREIKEAPSDTKSSYRGMCKKLKPSFFSKPYGKTSLWKQCMNEVTLEVRRRSLERKELKV